ncbi:MAG: hypothetical protein J6Q30_03540 [Oscillospiraceae bacterium]|nr:hypothetical protein [Oscillospiraceae bacterium]
MPSGLKNITKNTTKSAAQIKDVITRGGILVFDDTLAFSEFFLVSPAGFLVADEFFFLAAAALCACVPVFFSAIRIPPII